jgi:hypothetical protein
MYISIETFRRQHSNAEPPFLFKLNILFGSMS